MKLISRLLSIATVLSIIGITALNGCNRTAELTFTDAEVNFGNVPVLTDKTLTATIKNTHKFTAEITAIDKAAFEASGFFKLLDSECTVGMKLQENETCTVTLRFSPTLIQYSEARFNVTFFRPGAKSKKNRRHEVTSLLVKGTGSLDCSLHPALSQAREEGVTKAKQVNAQNTAQGKEDGEALTYNDGYSDGYAQGYQSGYNSGYNGSQGYPKGYDEGYASGLGQGFQDPAACSAGGTAGFLAGFSNGVDDGDYDGYNDGYDSGFAHGLSTGYFDGYDSGYYTGYNSGNNTAKDSAYNDGYSAGDSAGYSAGYSDGSYSCALGPKLQGGALPAPNEPIDPYYSNACYQQGYDAAYDPNAYKNAYEKAKAANPEYQAGRSDGSKQGESDGKADGIEDGYKEGLAQGKKKGLEDGKAAAYDDCYDANYPLGYYDGYDEAYYPAFDDGYEDGDDDGYDDSFSTGYSDGEDDGYSDGYANADTDDDWDEGYDDGYYAGYDDGFDDGYYDYCGAAAVRTESLLKSFRDQKQNRAPKSSNLIANPTHGKRYGTGKQWWVPTDESNPDQVIPGHARKADKNELTERFKKALDESPLTAELRSTDEGSQRAMRRESLARRHIKLRTPSPRGGATKMDAEMSKKFELRLKARDATKGLRGPRSGS